MPIQWIRWFVASSLSFYNAAQYYDMVKGEAVIFFIYSSGFYIGFYFGFTFLLLYWW